MAPDTARLTASPSSKQAIMHAGRHCCPVVRGNSLAIALVAGRDWPDVLVILPGGEVRTWHRWGKVGEEEAGELAWMWKRSARQ